MAHCRRQLNGGLETYHEQRLAPQLRSNREGAALSLGNLGDELAADPREGGDQF